MMDMEKVKYRFLKSMVERFGKTHLQEVMEIADLAEQAFLSVQLEPVEAPQEKFTEAFKRLLEDENGSPFDDDEVESSFKEDVAESFRIYEGTSDEPYTDPLKKYRLKDNSPTPDEYKQLDKVDRLEG